MQYKKLAQITVIFSVMVMIAGSLSSLRLLDKMESRNSKTQSSATIVPINTSDTVSKLGTSPAGKSSLVLDSQPITIQSGDSIKQPAIIEDVQKFDELIETVNLSQDKQLNIPVSGSVFGSISINLAKETQVTTKTPILSSLAKAQNQLNSNNSKAFGQLDIDKSESSVTNDLSLKLNENSIKADPKTEIKSDKQNGDSIKFEFGDPAKHLIFSKPVKINIPIDLPDFADFDIKVKHTGDQGFGYNGITNDPSKECDNSGNSIDQTPDSHRLTVIDKKLTFYTCGASTFVVSSARHTELQYIYPANGDRITSSYPTITGQVLEFDRGGSNNYIKVGETVSLTLNGAPLGTAITDNRGMWSITPTSPLPDGPNVICGDYYYEKQFLTNDLYKYVSYKCLTVNVNVKNFDSNINPSVIEYNSAQSNPLVFKAIFSKPITAASFDVSDIVTTGTATGQSITAITEIAPFDKTTFEITGQATGSGTFSVSIPESSYTFVDTLISSNLINIINIVRLDKNNNIFVVNENPKNIIKITPDGTSAVFFIPQTNGTYDLNNFVIDTDNNLYIKKYAPISGVCFGGTYSCGSTTSVIKIDPNGIETTVSVIPSNIIPNNGYTRVGGFANQESGSDISGNLYYQTSYSSLNYAGAAGSFIMKYPDGRSTNVTPYIPFSGLIPDFAGNMILIGNGIHRLTPKYQGVFSATREYNLASHTGDSDVTGLVGTQFPIIPFGGNDTTAYNNQNATFKIPNTSGGFSNVTGKILYNSFIPDDGKLIPVDIVTNYTRAKISIGAIDVDIKVNFSPIGSTNILGSQNVTSPYLSTPSNYSVFKIDSQVPNIPLSNSSISNGTPAKLEATNLDNPNSLFKTYTGTIQNSVFVPNPNQIVDNTQTGKFVGKLKVVGATTGILINIKSLSSVYTSSTDSPFISNPIGGAAGDLFPTFKIGGTTLDNGDVLTVVLPNLLTPVSGTYQNGFFVPNSGTLIPTDTPNIISGFLYGQLKYKNQSINIATNFTNPNYCGDAGGSTGPLNTFLQIFTGINVFAQSDTAGGTGATISASDCGYIYTPTTVTISVPSRTNNPKPPITGTCITGDNLTVTITPTNESFAGIICTNSVYAVTPTSNIPDGAYCGNVVALNPILLTSPVRSSATAQSCGVIDTKTNITALVPPVVTNPRPTITGTCEAGGAVTIIITNGNPSTNLLQTLPSFVCAANGIYSSVPVVDIPNGPYCASGRIVDDVTNIADSLPSCGIVDTSTFITTTVPPPTNNSTPTITGTCEAGGLVTIKITTGTPSVNLQQTLPNFTCDNTGTYTTIPPNPIPNGPYCANGHIVDISNNQADSVSSCGIIDNTTFITVDVSPVNYNPRPTITGTCEKDSTVSLKITNGNPSTSIIQTLQTFICPSTNTYSVIVTDDIPRGDYCANASIVDVLGNTATASPSCGRIDIGQFLTIAVPPVSTNPKPTITGTCEMGNTVTVTVTNGTPSTNLLQTLPQFTCPVSETYSIVPPANIPDGKYCANATAIDTLTAGGGGQPTSFTATPSCGIIDSTTFITVTVPPTTNDNTPTLNGTCEPLGVVTIKITTGSPSTTIQQTLPNFTCDNTSTYSVIPTTQIPNGPYCAIADIVDTVGNTASSSQQCGVVDTLTYVTITVPPTTDNPRPNFTGTCETGGNVVVTITTGSPSTQVLQALPSFTCSSTGTYSVVPTVDIPSGLYCGNASIIDQASNTAIATPSCGIVNTGNFVTISVPAKTNNSKPPITGTCEASAILNITITPTNETINGLVCPANNLFSINPTSNIPDGTYCASVVSNRNGGGLTVKSNVLSIFGSIEVSAESNTYTASAGPACGVIDTSTLVTITVPVLTKSAKPELTGTCENLTNIIVTITPTNETINTVCTAAGTYFVTPLTQIPDGAFSAKAKATDSFGNIANATGNGIVDSTTFVTIVLPALGTNHLPSFTGTCETGTTLELTITPTNEKITGITCLSGGHSIPATVYIPTGSYCGSILATDAIGNTATASGCGDILVTVEVPASTTDTKPTISGSCTPSTSGGFQVPVEVTIRYGTGSEAGNGTVSEVLNTTCSTLGKYTVKPTKEIPVGPYSATAKATSEIGNIATSTNSGNITVVPPKAEEFAVISDPYQCGKSITGKVTSSYGISEISIKLFAKNSTGYETLPAYTYSPTAGSAGDYEVKFDYQNENIFKKGEYKVVYSIKSSKQTIKTDSYIANITDKCSPLDFVATTVRTGGSNKLLYLIPAIIIIIGYGYREFKRSRE